MSIKIRLLLKDLREILSKSWYKMTKLLATYLDKREDRKYKEFKENITEEQAVKWIVKDIVKYLIRYRGRKVNFIVAEYINSEDFSGVHCLAYDPHFLIRSTKARKAYYNINRGTELQLKVINRLKETKGVSVEEFEEEFSSWASIRNYVKSYKISIG